MGNWIAGAILLILLIVAIVYVIRAKKNGQRCIGCPNAGCCPSMKQKMTEGTCCTCCQEVEHMHT